MNNFEFIPEVKNYFDMLRTDKSPETLRSYELSVDKFFEYLGIKSFDDIKKITPTQCRTYQSHLAKQVEKSSVNAYTRPLKAIFNLWETDKIINVSPFKNVKYLKTAKKLRAFLSGEEIDKMVLACKNLQEKTIFAVLVSTGLRRNELINLKFSDIVGEHIIVNGKGSKERSIQMQPEVEDLLDTYIEWRNKKFDGITDYVFVSKMSRKFSGQAIIDMVKRIARQAHIPEERVEEIGAHSMRHTFGANFLESGGDLKTLQILMGHASQNTTSDIYAHIRESVADRAIMNMKSILK